MEWYGWIAWCASILLSGYSAWRWWQEDRHRKATEPRWEILHLQNDAYTLKTKLPYTAIGVTLDSPVPFASKIADETFPPRTERKFMPSPRLGLGIGATITVTWKRKNMTRLYSETLLLPPKRP